MGCSSFHSVTGLEASAADSPAGSRKAEHEPDDVSQARAEPQPKRERQLARGRDASPAEWGRDKGVSLPICRRRSKTASVYKSHTIAQKVEESGVLLM